MGWADVRRPDSLRARRSRNSIWALVLRSSSAAHRARASWTDGSSRSRMFLRSATSLSGRLLVERAGIDDGLGAPIAAQYDEQIRDHGGLAFLVQLHDVLLGQPGQRHL